MRAPSSETSAQVEALLSELENAADRGERARILVRLGIVLRDDVADTEQALDALLGAWQADPTNPEVRDHLDPLVRREGRWHQVLDTTRALVIEERETARSLAYAEAMTTWFTREMAMPDQALHYLERVRDLDPTHWLVHLFQANRYAEVSDVKRELEALDRAVLSARRPEDRVRIHLLMAARYREPRTASTAEARRHLLAAHRLDAEDMDVLRALARLHADEGDSSSLAEVLEKQALASEGDSERVAVLMQLAELYEHQFLALDLAAEKLEQAFALDPEREDALAGLERCYTAMRSWDDLVRVREGAVDLVDDPDVQAERLLALAEVYETRMGDLPGALRAYERLDKLIPDDETLVGELARVAEKAGDWQNAARQRVRLAELCADVSTRARMLVSAGQLVQPHDALLARVHFERALNLDPTNATAWSALLADARASGDGPRLAQYLEERAGATPAPRAQAQIHAELGQVRRELEDLAGAIEAWESALACDPNNEVASVALLDEYVATDRWEQAWALLDPVLRAAERDGDVHRIFVTRRQACFVAVQLDRPEQALVNALAAFDLRPEDPDARQALVACAWVVRADPQVFDALESLGIILATTVWLRELDATNRAQLAEILMLTGDRDRAIELFEEVLAEQPDHAAALAGLAGLRAARGESLMAWTLKRQLADTVSDDQARFDLLLETAEGFASKAHRPDLAAEVYEQARSLRPNDHALLHKLLAQYQALEDWPNVFHLLRAIADIDHDPGRRSKVLVAMGQIVHGKLADPTSAVLLYDEALDLEPARLDAFERLVRILTETRDYRALERAYKRMIARVPRDVRLAHALHHQLGILQRDRLGDHQSAIASFRKATELQPDSEQDQAILRELLAGVGQAHDAISVTLERARRDPLEPAPYPALFELLLAEGHVDRAWCVASVLGHVGGAPAEAVALLDGQAPPTLGDIPGALGDAAVLLHPELDPRLTAIFELMAVAAIESRLASLGLRERLAHPGPAVKPPEPLLEDVRRAAHVLGVPSPKVYVARTPPGLTVAATRPPSLLLHAESLRGHPPGMLAFWLGKRLAELTPALLARGLFRSVTELKALVASAARIARADARTGLDKQDERLRAHLKKDQLRELGRAVEAVLAAGDSVDVKRWAQLADLSSSRAGLVLAGDVETARLAMLREPQAPGDLPLREQMRELVAFFLSDEYARVRAALGVRRA